MMAAMGMRRARARGISSVIICSVVRGDKASAQWQPNGAIDVSDSNATDRANGSAGRVVSWSSFSVKEHRMITRRPILALITAGGQPLASLPAGPHPQR
jgi:hypothetical protein